ncbi:MAG: carboxypeptidase-like regulatory domain-containing protein, partial [Chitinophagaceae bacterium]|nr:carboxypeptidase-like regulatory domain-containing protein [Chitinophagaceae bacterium]
MPLLILSAGVFSQTKIIKGVVKDIHSDERIPFASLEFKKSHSGKLTDSAGQFTLALNEWPQDTLIVTYVGYQDYILPIDSAFISKAVDNVIDFNIFLERGKY